MGDPASACAPTLIRDLLAIRHVQTWAQEGLKMQRRTQLCVEVLRGASFKAGYYG
jgi:hypothetical protein